MLTKKDAQKNNKNTKNPDPATATQAPAKAPSQIPAKMEATQENRPAKGNVKTRITVKYDVGFSNQLFIRGKGANLNWDKGQPFKNVKPDEWVWETDAHFNQCEFKVLINDHMYENGNNHVLHHGAALVYTPHFY